MDSFHRQIILIILRFIYVILLIVGIFVRKSVLSITYIFILAIFPGVHTIKGRSVLYLFTFLSGLCMFFSQITINFVFIKLFNTEVNLTSASEGCNSTSDMFIFEQLGFAWFSCDSTKTMLVKISTDLIILTISLILFTYNLFLLPQPSSPSLFRRARHLNVSHKKKLCFMTLDILACIIVVLIPIFNPNATSSVFFCAIIFYPLLKLFTSSNAQNSHYSMLYTFMRKFYVFIFYSTCILYMTILYLSQFSIIKEIVSLDHIIAKILRLTLFSHIEDISYDGTSITIISLHLILFAILWLKISYEHICHGRFDVNSVSFHSSSIFFHTQIFFKHHSRVLTTIFAFIWVVEFKNYLSFIVISLSLIPFLIQVNKNFRIFQISLLSFLYFGSFILQYMCTITFGHFYQLSQDYDIFVKSGIYSCGYAPHILAIKYVVFISAVLAFSSLYESYAIPDTYNYSTLSYTTFCGTCENIIEEKWLIHPNFIVQFFTYLLSVFSRPIICIYPLLELQKNNANVHSFILISIFLLLSVTQTKKKGWERMQKICLLISNYYMSLWILVCSFVQIFDSSLLDTEKFPAFNRALDLFDLKSDYQKTIVTSYTWLLVSLGLNKFILSYYNSVLISNSVVIVTRNEVTRWPTGRYDLLSVLNFLLFVIYHYFLKLNQFMVVNRRLIISIICFVMSLVRPSLITFLPFYFSCLYATSYHKKSNVVISSILVFLSIVIVLIMVMYQIKGFPTIVLSPILKNCTGLHDESSIATGLSKIDSYPPIFAFLCVVFIFSFLNSLSKYYEIGETNPNTDTIIIGSRSYFFHVLRNIITYWGYELIILTGIIAVVFHKDTISVISITLLIILVSTCPYLYGYTNNNRPYFIQILKVYKYCVVIIMIIRFSLHVFCPFLTCLFNLMIKDKKKFNMLNQLFIERTISSNNKMKVIYDFIHIFIIRIYCRDLVKNRIEKLEKNVQNYDFTLCKNFFDYLQHVLFFHFIQLVFIVTYFGAFYHINFLNISYVVCCGFIIIFEQRMYFSYHFKLLVNILTFLPLIIIACKIFVNIFFCLNPSMFKGDAGMLLFFFSLTCPNTNPDGIMHLLPDVVILSVFLIQNRIHLSSFFNNTVVNYYLYRLESDNISSIITKENDFHRSDYEKKLRIRREKIKNSISDIKKQIECDWEISPSSKTKIPSLYSVDQTVFDRFYSHRDEQNQIFRQYPLSENEDNDHKAHKITFSIESYIFQQPSSQDKIHRFLYFLASYTFLLAIVDIILQHILRINTKERDRRNKIITLISDGKRIHNEELKRVLLDVNPGSDYNHTEDLNEDTPASERSEELPPKNIPLFFLINVLKFCWYFIIRNTGIFVFFAMLINQLYSSSILSLFVVLSYLLYAAIVVPRPPPAYWRIVSLFVLFSSLARYITSIYPLNEIFTCSNIDLPSNGSINGEGNFCIFRMLGIDGWEYSPFPDLFLLVFIQIHIVALHYRGLLVHDIRITAQNSEETPPFYERCKKKLKSFMKNYETGICTLEPDYYIIIFLTQLGQWFIIAFSWSSFIGPTTFSGDITQIIKGSVIPVSFSILISLQSFCILFDRFINLNRMRSIKLIYTVFLVISIHIIVFFVIPQKTQKGVLENIPVCIFYILYCIYFYYSFIPIRNGYNSTNMLPYSIARYHNYCSIGIIYFLIYFPFVYELDSILRWFSSTTFSGFFKFIKINDIFFNLHVIKSFRKISQKQRGPKSVPYSYGIKLSVTIMALLIFLVSLLLPLWLYSTGISAINSVLPTQIEFSVSINGYYPLYESSVIRSNFVVFKKEDSVDSILDHLEPENRYFAKSVLLDYKELGDIIYVEFPEPSFNSWIISSPSRKLLLRDIKANLSNLIFRLRFKLHRDPSELKSVFGAERVEGSFMINISSLDSDRIEFQTQLYDAVKNLGSCIMFQQFLPFTIRVEPYKPLYSFEGISKCLKKTVCVYHESGDNQTLMDEWWKFTTLRTTNISLNSCMEGNNSTKIEKMGIYFFIDFLKSSYIDLFSPSRNVIALYIILISSVSTFLKKFFLNTSHLIMFQEIPNPDYILNLCQYIYRARWSGDVELEEFFVSILFFIYRSPETLIRTTHLRDSRNVTIPNMNNNELDM